MADADFTLDIGLDSRCIRCHAARDLDGLDGELIASGDSTHIIQSATPCACGERRVKVSVSFDDD